MANYRQLDQQLFIGPQPSLDDLHEAKQQGVRTVIDLRLPSETSGSNGEMARAGGLAYVNIPVDKTALSEADIDALEAAMKQYEAPCLVHCATGARAAMLLALSQARQGRWTAQRTFAEAEAMGFKLQNMPGFAAFIEKARGGRAIQATGNARRTSMPPPSPRLSSQCPP